MVLCEIERDEEIKDGKREGSEVERIGQSRQVNYLLVMYGLPVGPKS